MSAPRVSFAPKLATVVREEERKSTATTRVVTLPAVLIRIAAIGLVVAGIASGLHFGTAGHREAMRKTQIEQAIATSGVVSGTQAAETEGSARHE
jgi:hypothetical protein